MFGLLLSLPARSITVPNGDIRPIGPADIGPHPQNSKTHNEFWTYQFLLTGGVQIQVNFSRAKFGSMKDPVCGADLSIAGFKGRDYFVAREYPATNFKYDSLHAKLAVHENIYFEGIPPKVHHVYFSTVKKNVSYNLDLAFEDMKTGMVWGDGVFGLKDDQKIGLFIQIPGAKVRGQLIVNQDTLSLEGMGWMDHSYQTQFATKLIDAGYRYVVSTGNIEGGIFFQSREGIFGYGLRYNNGDFLLLRPKGIRVTSQTSWAGTNVAEGLEIAMQGLDTLKFRRKENRQFTSALAELGSMERFGAKIFLGGEILGFKGKGVVNENIPALFSFTVIKH